MVKLSTPPTGLMIFIIILSISLGSTLLFSQVALLWQGTVIEQLAISMSGTGILTTVISYVLYRTHTLSRLGSIQWAFGTMIAFTVGLVMVNLWIISQRMFFSTVYLSMMLSVLVFATLTALTFGYFIAKAMTDRLKELSTGANELSKGNLQHQLAVNGNDEIAKLTEHFNHMAKELATVDEEKQKLEQARRDLIAWVSHDLRTPLTTMRVMLEALTDGIISDEKTQKRYLNTSLGEIEHLSHLIDDLFELVQLDVKGISLDITPTSLRDLISDTVSAFHAKAENKAQRISANLRHTQETIRLAPDKIQRVLSNLLDNAIKYSPPEAEINISTTSENGYVSVCIRNYGVSLSKESTHKVFDSFYRGETSRMTQNGERGVGLGLAIAKGFVEAHQGVIWAESDNQSTSFVFTLPC